MSPAIRNYFLLFFGCLCFHLAGTWSLPLIDRDEPRFAEAAREMRQRHDYIVPFFNGQYRFDKPPWTYWLQIASYRIFGENDFAARFPTCVAAALTALLLCLWGTQVGNRRIGWWAAVIFTLALQVLVHGKAAVADMWLVLFVTMAHWAGWQLMFADKGERGASDFRLGWWVIFYVSLALAFLAKGPIGWTPLLTIMVFAVIRRRWRPLPQQAGVAPGARPSTAAIKALIAGGLNARFHFLAGITMTLLIVSAWGVPALLRTHGQFFTIGIGKHVIGRSFAPMEGHGAGSPLIYFALLPFYFGTVFVSFFPWSIKLPALCKRLWQQRDDTDIFLVSGGLIIFLIFSLVRTKLPHYTLPAFPLLSLLMARRWDTLRLRPALAIASGVVYLLVALLVTPLLAPLLPSAQLARLSRLALQPQMEFSALDYTEPSLVWYFRRSVLGFMNVVKRKQAAGYMKETGARFIILPTNSAAALFPSPDPRWHRYRAKGFNPAKGSREDLTLLLKTD